jgi:hypothetical protein
MGKITPNDTKGEDAPLSETADVVGGFPFFLSLAALLPTGLLFTILAVARIPYSDPGTTVAFIVAILVGALCAKLFIRKHISVLIHEFKHSLISNLVGNKHKGMKIDEDSGYYRWAYTKNTAHFNAFIALAPYIVPVFTFVGCIFALTFSRHDRFFTVILVGIGYGTDLLLNIRDISPIQTDITLIRGGYKIGVLYIIAWNLLIAGILLTWAFNGGAGLLILLEDISMGFVYLYFWLFGGTPE